MILQYLEILTLKHIFSFNFFIWKDFWMKYFNIFYK